jgi:hypothetical protein
MQLWPRRSPRRFANRSGDKGNEGRQKTLKGHMCYYECGRWEVSGLVNTRRSDFR